MQIPLHHSHAYFSAHAPHAPRAELLLLLLVQHMLEEWPELNRNASNEGAEAWPPSYSMYLSKASPSHHPDKAAQQRQLQQLQQRLGGWKEYLDALRQCWEPVFAWYAAGSLTNVSVLW